MICFSENKLSQRLDIRADLLPGDKLHDPHVHRGGSPHHGRNSRGALHDHRQTKVPAPLNEGDTVSISKQCNYPRQQG